MAGGARFVMALAVALARPLPVNGEVPFVQPDIEVKCAPKKLYCGDTLTIEVKGPHAGAELAIGQAYYREVYLLSFPPGPKDRIPPAIPADQFAKMKRLRLRTDRAVGSPADGWIGDCVPRVKGPPELIFTATGKYEVTVGYRLFSPDVDYEAPLPGCVVEYNDYPRPKPGEQPDYENLCHPGAADERRRKDDEEAERAPRYAPLKCEPKVLYKGDVLSVDLPVPHDDYEIGIERLVPNSGEDPLLLSFKPNPPDTIAPVIPFETFRRMKRVKIVTTEAKGSEAAGANIGPCFKRVEDPPKPIFTMSGDYLVQIGPSLGGEEHDQVGDCVVHYIDRPRPPARSEGFQR